MTPEEYWIAVTNKALTILKHRHSEIYKQLVKYEISKN